jgi:glycosyltransferase involved in cell wall biosynthesis
MVNPHLGPVLGGIQKDMLCLAREFTLQGDRVAFVTTYDEFPNGRINPEQPPTYQLPPGIPTVRLEGYLRTRLRNFHPANSPLWIPGLTRAVMQFRPDAVIIFNIGWPLTVLPALLTLRRRTIVLYRTAYHAYDDYYRLNPLRGRLQLGVAGLSHRLLSYSHYEKKQIVEQGHIRPELIVPVYPGVEAASPTPADLAAFRSHYRLHHKLVISHVARLSTFKGTDKLIRALPQVRQRTEKDVVLLLVGRNMEKEFLEGLVHERGMEDHVCLTGPLSDQNLQLAYAVSDVFAMPSQYESLGLVFLEAMSHGVPAIGVRTGGVAEVIRHMETGFILDSPDDTVGLTEALVHLVQDEALRKNQGEAAQRWTGQQFTWFRAMETIRSVVRSLEK